MGLKKLFGDSSENSKKNILLRNQPNRFESENTAASLAPADQSRKTARQRLIGALALLLVAIVLLPMVLDEEVQTPDIGLQLQIPSKDQDANLAQQHTNKEQITQEFSSLGTVIPEESPMEQMGVSNEPSAQKTSESGVEQSKTSSDSLSSSVAGLSSKDNLSKKKSVVDTLSSQSSVEKSVSKPTEKPLEKFVAEKSKPSARSQAKESDESNANISILNDPIASFANKSVAKLDAKIDAKTSGKPQVKLDEQLTLKPAVQVNHWIQIAAYSNEAKARSMAEQIRTKGFPAVTEVVRTSNGDLYRVRVGPFESKEIASRSRDKLNQFGFEGSLVQ